MGHHWPGADWPGNDRPDHRSDHRSGGGSWGGSWSSGPGRRQGGPPPWLGEIFGFATAPQRPQQRGPRVKRGDVRTAIIDVLHRARRAEEPINGYQVIQEISELSSGEWRPSPGSVYPTIQQLQDEGLVESDDERGRRTIRLTDQGVTWAEEHADELAAVWAPFTRTEQPVPDQPSGQADIKSEIGQVVSAVWQLATQGSEQQRRAALDVLVDTRRRLYGILADGRDVDGRDDER
ncbi:DNA-binding PadR family transcriptional regulator [Nocardioides sp. BE266]|uniref:PadR family transcriptional regulator n=1 Tax=Nocardioides sp. BE266 TaxID=2817725 RepID=UPI00285A7363|nr:PadR family transcriptional regulator [Nocardioides sp. BE266]MDR7251487.1 DNA-binding PadR family transcriptional regulator [Nocardioides sp. BE266]